MLKSYVPHCTMCVLQVNPDISVVRTPGDLIDVVPKLGDEVVRDICLTQVINSPKPKL